MMVVRKSGPLTGVPCRAIDHGGAGPDTEHPCARSPPYKEGSTDLVDVTARKGQTLPIARPRVVAYGLLVVRLGA